MRGTNKNMAPGASTGYCRTKCNNPNHWRKANVLTLLKSGITPTVPKSSFGWQKMVKIFSRWRITLSQIWPSLVFDDVLDILFPTMHFPWIRSAFMRHIRSTFVWLSTNFHKTANKLITTKKLNQKSVSPTFLLKTEKS